MNNRKLNNESVQPILSQGAQNVNAFANAVKAFETAYASGNDYGNELQTLATAIAHSILKKLLDPQAKTAAQRESVSDNGINPAINAMRIGVSADTALLANLRENSNAATTVKFDRDGKAYAEVIDTVANDAVNAILEKTLSDGIDIVQETALALLETASRYANIGGNWLEQTVTIRKLSKRVYIVGTDENEFKYTEQETTPIQLVFRAVNRYVQNNRAIQANLSGYTYLDAMTADDVERVYFRLKKYADIGGYACNDNDVERLAGAPAAYSTSGGNYTADAETALEYYDIINRLGLTDSLATVLSYREQGYSIGAIADRLNITDYSARRRLYRLQDAAAALGFAPKGWTAESRTEDASESKRVEQFTADGERMAVYESVSAAARCTGIDKANISAAADGKRTSAGGYKWARVK